MRRWPEVSSEKEPRHTTEPPPPIDAGIRPEILWRDGTTAILALPGGREFATDIRRESLATKVAYGGGAGPDASLVRVGNQSLWGDVKWMCFSVDPSSVAEDGAVVRGVGYTKSSAVSFEMSCDTSGAEPMFVSGVPSAEEEGGDEYEDDATATRLLSTGMRTGRGLKCSVKEDGTGHALAALYAPSDRECAVFAWRLIADGACRRWRWVRSGDVKFVLPVGFKGGLLDCADLDGDCVVVRQPGLPDLRFEMDDSEMVSDSGVGARWSYGDAVWDIAKPGDDPSSLAGRLGRSSVSVLCCPNDFPELAEAWRGAGLSAARAECERTNACPVYIEVRRDATNPGLKALLGSVMVDRILLVLEITEPPDQSWLVGDDLMSEDVRDLVGGVRDAAGRGGPDFRCVAIGQPAVCDYIHDRAEEYVSTTSSGPYTEMPDEFVARCLGRDTGIPDSVLEEAYIAIKEHCLARWETSLVDEDGDRYDPGLPFMLPVAQAQRVLREAVSEGEGDGRDILRRVRGKLSEMGGGPPEMPPEMRRRLAELPLLLREGGGEVLYGQDEAIWATQRHLQAHLLRAAENKPTFVFYVGVNGLGKTTLAINSIRALGGALEEINCASLDNAYGYGERAGFAALNRKIDTLRASPSPLKALLLDEVDKNVAVLKALIKLADSDAVASRGMLDHPLAGVFVFITLNVVPDCSEHRKFVEEDEPGPRMERLRDLVVASVKNTGDPKVVHAIISRLVPYLVVFNELGADGDRSRRHMASLAEDEVRGFAKEYGIRVVLDDDALAGLVKRSAVVSLGGFRSVRSAMRREIESAVGDMCAQRGGKPDGTVVLRDAGTHLSAASAEEGDTVLYAIAVTRHKRISAAVRESLDRMLEMARLRDDDSLRLDRLDVMATAFGYLADAPLFSVDGSEAKFTLDDTALVGVTSDEDRTRLLKASLAELKRKVAHHTRELLESGQQQVDSAVQDILDEANRFYRLSLPDDMSEQHLPSAAPPWASAAWEGYLKSESGASSKTDAVKEAFREMTAEWSRLSADQEDSMSDVRKFPELRARAAKRSAEIAASLAGRAEKFGLDKDTLVAVNEMAIDATASAEKKLTEKDVLRELELESDSFDAPPMSVHLMAGAATAFLADRLIRDMLREDYSVADRARAAEKFKGPNGS